MKTIHTIKIELNKTILNMGFLLAVLITTALQFTNQVYIDGQTGKTYSALQLLLDLQPHIIKEDPGLSSIMIFSSGLAGYFIMFIPIIAAFPFIPNFCAERNSGLIRFAIQRTGKVRYYAVKFIASLLGGGFAVSLGFALFGILAYVLFPSINHYGLSQKDISSMIPGGIGMRVMLILLGAFIYGAVSTIPAFFMASFVKNRYIITCVPFVLVYLYSTSLTKFIFDATACHNEKLITLLNTLKPEQVTTLFFKDSISRNSLYIDIGFIIVMFILFVLIMNKRRDLGE